MTTHASSARGKRGIFNPATWMALGLAAMALGYLGLLALTSPTTGDLLAGTGRVQVGLAPAVGGQRLRIALQVDADLSRASGAERVDALPGLQLGLEF